jgi:tetraacyldisaccharide 4'-kinase
MHSLEHYWYTHTPWLRLLAPAALIYCLSVNLRRLLYRAGILRCQRMPVPVLVVGNLTPGGTGKTPLVAWLATRLKQSGYRPGIVARGYRGRARRWPRLVRPDSDPVLVGDEAVLLAGLCGCPVAVAPRRAEAARLLLEHNECDLILSDDGLQHYALDRDIEIAVMDGTRRTGNGRCLPAGPLREPAGRLTEVDLVVVNGLVRPGEYPMKTRCTVARRLPDGGEVRELESFRGQPVHAVAGIGNPDRFFRALRQAGLEVAEHAFPDHHDFRPHEIDFSDGLPVIMTEKDAVKCRNFNLENGWFVPLAIEMGGDFEARVLELVAAGRNAADPGVTVH